MPLQWFAIETKRHEEDKACANLKDQGCPQIFFPREHVKKIKRKILVEEWVPIFARIIFAQFDPSDLATFNWGLIKHTRGCRKLLTSMDMQGYPKPSPIADEIIDEIMSRKPEKDVLNTVKYRSGEEVLIKVGQFADWPAKFLGSKGERATVIIDFMGSKHTLPVLMSNLAKKDVGAK